MTLRRARRVFERGLPRLSGRPLWTYRAAWILLAVAASASVVATLVAGMEPAIAGLRVLKSALVIGVAALLFWRRPRDPVAALLALAFLSWTVTSNVDFTTGALLPMLLDRLRFLLFALALLLFPNGKWLPRSNAWVALASVLICLLGVAEVLILPSGLYLPLAIGCILTAIGTLVQRFRSTAEEGERQQLKWVALGLVSGVGAILAARTGDALAGSRVGFEALFQVGIVLVALGFLVPLLRYRLYDAEAAISRSAALAGLTVALVATFAGAEAIIEWAGQQFLGMGIGDISAAMAAAVAAVLLNPLHSRISDWAERRFQYDLVEMKTRMPALLDQVPPGWSAKQIGEAALPLITAAIHANGAAIFVGGKTLARTGDFKKLVLELPLRSHFGHLRGSLRIGPRADGCSYGQDDIEAVASVLPALSNALSASLQAEQRTAIEDVVREIGAQIARLSSRVEAVESRIKADHAHL